MTLATQIKNHLKWLGQVFDGLLPPRRAFSFLIRSTALFACSVALLSCSAGCLFYSACNLPVVFPGVYVQVLNDQTGQGITNAVVTVTAGQYSETLSLQDTEGHYVGGYGLTGTLSLTVEAPGFVSQQLDNVVVESLPDCQIIPASLTIRLTPTN